MSEEKKQEEKKEEAEAFVYVMTRNDINILAKIFDVALKAQGMAVEPFISHVATLLDKDIKDFNLLKELYGKAKKGDGDGK